MKKLLLASALFLITGTLKTFAKDSAESRKPNQVSTNFGKKDQSVKLEKGESFAGFDKSNPNYLEVTIKGNSAKLMYNFLDTEETKITLDSGPIEEYLKHGLKSICKKTIFNHSKSYVCKLALQKNGEANDPGPIL